MESEGRWLPPGVLPVGGDDLMFWCHVVENLGGMQGTQVMPMSIAEMRSLVDQCWKVRYRSDPIGLRPSVPTDSPSLPPPIGKVKA